ncbi:MAG: rod shape-determining protein RodA [Armatimonadota bacterium]|nr:rod shape-determining protein RodA [Armatimonadota bacterium]MDW8157121.1 rod shape-determining protein RodA [Armatimonadota bacterium]
MGGSVTYGTGDPRPLRRRLRHVDWVLVGCTLALVALGTVAVASATTTPDRPLGLLRPRLAHVALGMLALVGTSAVPYQTLGQAWKLVYGAALALLALTDLVGRTALGAQRWLSVGPVSVQPSEVAKLGLVVALAWSLSRRQTPPQRLLELAPSLLLTLPPMLLVFLQPDLGSALVFVAILLAMLWAAGVPRGHLAGLVTVGVLLAPAAWPLLKPYQRARILAFLDPNQDPLGAGYNLIQSKIAIGSGGMWGKGLFAGTQNTLQFLPMQHTDFVFSVVGEELGFVGTVGVLVLFWVWLLRVLRVASTARDAFGSYLCVGVAGMVAFHVLVNVGMTVGLAPPTGIPLPFVSYGGTALVTQLAAVGLVLSVAVRRPKILF